VIVQATRISRHGGVQYLARHLLDKFAENDRIEVLSGDRHALHDALALAKTKGCRYCIRHLSISSEREMTPRQLTTFFRSIDAEFGIGSARPLLVVRHVKKGRSHFHVAIAEVDPATLKVLDCRHDYTRLEALARRYEQDHGETVQPTRIERRKSQLQGFSDVARKRAERITAKFDRTKLKKSYANGIDVFLTEVRRQGMRIAQGKKGSILVDEFGAFVAAANRVAGVKRESFENAIKGISHEQQRNGNKDLSRDATGSGGKEYIEPGASPGPPGASTWTRQDRATPKDAKPTFGLPAAPSAGIEVRRRQDRPNLQTLSLYRRREEIFLHRLGKLDLDDLLRRARALSEWMKSIFESKADRLVRQIEDIKQTRKLFPPADAPVASGPSYNMKKRIPL